jgi:hypothetical protein
MFFIISHFLKSVGTNTIAQLKIQFCAIGFPATEDKKTFPSSPLSPKTPPPTINFQGPLSFSPELKFDNDDFTKKAPNSTRRSRSINNKKGYKSAEEIVSGSFSSVVERLRIGEKRSSVV